MSARKRERPASTAPTPSPQKARRVKKEDADVDPNMAAAASVGTIPTTPGGTSVKSETKEGLSDRKLAAYSKNAVGSPFPGFNYPSHADAEQVAYLLAEWHGYKSEGGKSSLPRHRKPTSAQDIWGGCGNVPNVLDALIRTVLSCNTSNRNSTAAHKSMVARFGALNWEAMLEAPHEDLVDSIRCGGLANNKGRTIRNILEQTRAKHGVLSLDHLHDPSVTDEDIMRELLAFSGVGPKVATCVSMFCIGRQTMAVDTHVWRLSKMLGWVPDKATRDQTCYHLEEKLQPELKYPLHVLLIKHGKMCKMCSARGFATVKMDEHSSSSDDGDDAAEEEEDLGEEGGEEEQSKEEKKRIKEKPCPLRQHGLVHKRTYSKKTAAAAAVSPLPAKAADRGDKVKREAKKEELEEQSAKVKAERSPTKRAKTEGSKAVKKEESSPTRGTRTSSRKR